MFSKNYNKKIRDGTAALINKQITRHICFFFVDTNKRKNDDVQTPLGLPTLSHSLMVDTLSIKTIPRKGMEKKRERERENFQRHVSLGQREKVDTKNHGEHRSGSTGMFIEKEKTRVPSFFSPASSLYHVPIIVPC